MYLTGQRKKCISFFLVGILVFVTLAGAVLSAPVCVYALSLGGLRGTIASLIISLMLSSGAAPVNNAWLDSLNNAYGVESSIGTIDDMITNGLLTESGGTLIDTGLSSAIESVPEYTSLGISEIFASDTLVDVGVETATAATNLTNSAINLGTLGTIGAFAGAATVGVGIGVLAAHLIDKYGTQIRSGFPAYSNQWMINQVGAGQKLYYPAQGYEPMVASETDTYGYYFISGSNTTYKMVNITNNSITYKLLKMSNNTSRDAALSGNSSKSTTAGADAVKYGYGYELVENDTEGLYKVNSAKNDGYRYYPKCPDFVSPSGNIGYNPQTDTFDGIGNIIPEGGDMRPVDMDDYRDYVDQANNNTENNDIGEDIQGSEFDEFVDQYIVDPSQEPVVPDQPVEVPDYPDRPVTPDQPTIPDKPDVSNEDIQQSLEGATTIDLRSVFPFCIPWDIYNLVLIFDTGDDREAPHITFTFPFNENWIIDVDLAEYDDVAAILRLLELILFVMGLMVATRALIGAKG